MKVVGTLSSDSPDPRAGSRAELARFPGEIITLAAQPTIEESDMPGIMRGQDSAGITEMAVSLTYTLIRNPSDRSAPENLADLDDDLRRALDEVPPWPRPQWLIAMNESLRFPQLWEAVQTSWRRDDMHHGLDEALLHHVDHLLRNRFRRDRGLEGHMGALAPAPDVTARAIQRDISVLIDGEPRPGIMIDTDPHVYAVAADLRDGRTLTAVIPRDELDHVRLEFVTRRVPDDATA